MNYCRYLLLFCTCVCFSGNVQAQEKLSLFERAKLKIAVFKDGNIAKITDALILGVKYGKQASQDEAQGYELAHEKAAYEWGYDVGDPALVKMVRFYWESVQLGIFSIGDYQESTKGEKSDRWKTIESLVGANGKDYAVNQEYLNDIMHDVSIATDGAIDSQSGLSKDFDNYVRNLSD